MRCLCGGSEGGEVTETARRTSHRFGTYPTHGSCLIRNPELEQGSDACALLQSGEGVELRECDIGNIHDTDLVACP